MRFDRIRLQNFKPYADADVRLGDGVTVIHGLNGSGKSSLLEACFFALYGSSALDENLDDVITNGEEEAEIALWFTHDGGEYHIERRLRASGDQTKTATCVLEGPDGEESVDGARAVKRRVTELLRMDDEAFVNCAYVRQGEVNKLINATPGQRQDMIDDLLQLGKLEEYRERAGQARLGVEDVLGDRRGRLSQLEDQIDEKRGQDLHDRLNALESERNEVAAKIEKYEGNRREAERTRDEAAEILETHDEARERLDAVEDDLTELREEVRETESRREEIREEVRERRAEIEEREAELDDRLAATTLDAADAESVEARLAELDERDDELAEAEQDSRMKAQAFENQASNLREKADELGERATEKRSTAAELEDEADTAAAELDDRRDRLEELDDGVRELEARFEDAPVAFGEAADLRDDRRDELSDLRERERELRAELGTVESRVEEAERLLDEGKCPECGQPVDGSPHVDSLDDHRERRDELREELDALGEEIDDAEEEVSAAESLVEAETRLRSLRENRENVAELIDQREAAIAEKREKAESLREEADDLESRAAETREVAAEKAEAEQDSRDEAAEVTARREELADARERVEGVRDLRGGIASLEDEVASLHEKREHLAEMNGTNRERLDEKRERRDELREELADVDIETQRERKRNAEEYIDDVTDELDRLRERRDELQNRIGGVKQDLSQLSDLVDRRDELAERVEALEDLHEETSDLEALYADLRAELRQRNVESLERMLNETFDLVYANDAYSHIELDGEYELTVYQKDGRALDPEQLSGGERALFNLSLRAAIYRLLAEGIEGTAPMPPLILDEPTVFLDAGHVSRLVGLVEEMRGLGVRQIIIVSHDEELVGAADDLVTVEKDPTTNRSTARREDAATLGAVEAGADD